MLDASTCLRQYRQDQRKHQWPGWGEEPRAALALSAGRSLGFPFWGNFHQNRIFCPKKGLKCGFRKRYVLKKYTPERASSLQEKWAHRRTRARRGASTDPIKKGAQGNHGVLKEI